MLHETLWIATVTLRYPNDEIAMGGVVSSRQDHAECLVSNIGTAHKDGKYGIDDDALKKAITDGLTKCLSYTGMNADVFLGRFDDNKYVAEMREKFKPESDAGPATGGDLGKAKADLVAYVEDLRKDLASRMTTNVFIRTVIKNHTGEAMLNTVGAVRAVRRAIEDGLYDLVTGERVQAAGKPTPEAAAPDRDLRAELYAFAERLWPGEASAGIKHEADKIQTDVLKLTDDDLVGMIEDMREQLEGVK